MLDGRRYFAGIDIGSVTIKVAVADDRQIVASGLIPSGGNYAEKAIQLLHQVLSGAEIAVDSVCGTVATGVGCGRLLEAKQVSDLSCHAIGCHSMLPGARTIVDIGGQFTKAAKLTPGGSIADFLISEKCAAGSGRFLQVIARILQVRLEDIGPLSLTSCAPVEFSTNCAVFAESETLSRIAEGARKEDILAGVHSAMACKVAMLVKRVGMEADVVLTGGGGEDIGLVKAVRKALNIDVQVPREPRLTAAVGAALIARENGQSFHDSAARSLCGQPTT